MVVSQCGVDCGDPRCLPARKGSRQVPILVGTEAVLSSAASSKNMQSRAAPSSGHFTRQGCATRPSDELGPETSLLAKTPRMFVIAVRKEGKRARGSEGNDGCLNPLQEDALFSS